MILQVGNANKKIIGLWDPFAHGLKCWCLEALFWRVQSEKSEKLPWTCKATDQRVTINHKKRDVPYVLLFWDSSQQNVLLSWCVSNVNVVQSFSGRFLRFQPLKKNTCHVVSPTWAERATLQTFNYLLGSKSKKTKQINMEPQNRRFGRWCSFSMR